MRTNIVLDEALVTEARRYATVRTKRDVVNLALREFVENHRRTNLLELYGKGLIDPSYDYKKAREGHRSHA